MSKLKVLLIWVLLLLLVQPIAIVAQNRTEDIDKSDPVVPRQVNTKLAELAEDDISESDRPVVPRQVNTKLSELVEDDISESDRLQSFVKTLKSCYKFDALQEISQLKELGSNQKPLYYMAFGDFAHIGWAMNQTIEYTTEIVYSITYRMRTRTGSGRFPLEEEVIYEEIYDKSGNLKRIQAKLKRETGNGEEESTLKVKKLNGEIEKILENKRKYCLNDEEKSTLKVRSSKKFDGIAEILKKIKQKKVWCKGDTISCHIWDFIHWEERNITLHFVKSEKMKILGKEEKVYYFFIPNCDPYIDNSVEIVIHPNGNIISYIQEYPLDDNVYKFLISTPNRAKRD